jgi:hypothetical protein
LMRSRRAISDSLSNWVIEVLGYYLLTLVKP